MVTTYSTSLECAHLAGIRNFGTSSRPNETEVDEMRKSAYGKIRVFTNTDPADDTDYILNSIEKDLVLQYIYQYWGDERAPQEVKLSQHQIDLIQSQFPGNSQSLAWEPGANA